jgi:DNA polymerase-3 subunit alpha (Gram-positive type)
MYQVAIEMLRRGYNFLQVDINKSLAKDFVIEGNSLRLPFASIPGLGPAVAEDVVLKREEKPFTNHIAVYFRRVPCDADLHRADRSH